MILCYFKDGFGYMVICAFVKNCMKVDSKARDNQGVKPARLSLVLAARPTCKCRVETPHWRNVRTAQGSVAANGCPLKPVYANTWKQVDN